MFGPMENQRVCKEFCVINSQFILEPNQCLTGGSVIADSSTGDPDVNVRHALRTLGMVASTHPEFQASVVCVWGNVWVMVSLCFHCSVLLRESRIENEFIDGHKIELNDYEF